MHPLRGRHLRGNCRTSQWTTSFLSVTNNDGPKPVQLLGPLKPGTEPPRTS